MYRGGTESQTQGFTIVETLIVLAVTGMLFTVAAVTINGRQNKTDFQVGSRLIVQQLQKAINETQTGYYPSQEDFTCRVNTGTGDIEFPNPDSDRGTNDTCILAGRTLVFSSRSGSSNAYNVYSLAGKRLSDSSDQTSDTTSPFEAQIKAIPDGGEREKVPNGLQFYGGKYKSTDLWTTNTRFPVALLSGLADFQGTSNGSQRVELRGYKPSLWSSVINESEDEAAINSEITDSNSYGSALENVELCFNSGGTDQSIVVTISGGLQVSYTIKQVKNCL